jgi:NodT family efflux transporter outer membrane factor (OMF) lipoprotein
VPTPPAFKEIGNPNSDAWKLSQPRDDIDRGKWWTWFEDQRLNELEEKVNISNQTVAASVANLLAARAIVREARAAYFPTVGVGASITNQRLSQIFGTSAQTMFTTYNLPLSATWEPDLWGRVRNNVEANSFAAQASAADLANVRLAAQADLAATYYELRGADALIQVFERTARAFQEALDINRALFQSGLASDEPVALAEAQLKDALARASSTRILRAQYEHAIAVLIGESPSTFCIAVETFRGKPPAIPVGVPSELLERRPDIAAAERAVAQANAQIGLAKTAYFPTLLLSATGGLQSPSISQWFTWPARFWAVGPALAQTVFDGGLRKATVQQFEATYDQTAANYRQTVLVAFQQVEDNLAALRHIADAIELQDAAVSAAARGVDTAKTRYRAGLDLYLNVVVDENLLLNYEQLLVAYRTQQMVAAVQLIKALGGGWDVSQLPTAKEMTH